MTYDARPRNVAPTPEPQAWLYFAEEEDPDARWILAAEYYDLDAACLTFERYTGISGEAIAADFRTGSVASFETVDGLYLLVYAR